MTGSSSAGAPRRRKLWPLWLSALVTIATTVAVISIGFVVWGRSLPWPPLVAPGDALGIIIAREGLLPDGATCRGSGKAWAVRVFGIMDPVGQERLVDGVRREMRSRGKPHGYDSLEIEFWSGEPPPPGENVWTEQPRTGSALARTVRVP